jgi:mevalonate pyrophosphate decarboxylase
MVLQMDPKKIKGKEFFTIEVDLNKNNITLYLNGELRNKIHTVRAEYLFDRMLKIAKQKFLKMREQIEQ